MKNKNLERTIKNLQKVIEKRSENNGDEETELEEDEELIPPLSVSFATYGGITNGGIGAVVGFLVGRGIEEITYRSDIAAIIVYNLLNIIHEVNSDKS